MQSDILGANLYRHYVSGVVPPAPRCLPSDVDLLPQMVVHVESILVSTGVHSSDIASDGGGIDRHDINDCRLPLTCHSHRDFADVTLDMFTPTVTAENVKHAVEYILQRQHGCT